MTADAYRFEFRKMVSLTEAEMSLHLARYAVQGLYGEARVRLDTSYHIDRPHRTITVVGGKDVGASLVKVYTSLLIREFGEKGFRVRRWEPTSKPANDDELGAEASAAEPATA